MWSDMVLLINHITPLSDTVTDHTWEGAAGGAVDVLVDCAHHQRRRHGEHHVVQRHVEVCACHAPHTLVSTTPASAPAQRLSNRHVVLRSMFAYVGKKQGVSTEVCASEMRAHAAYEQ